MKKLLLFVLAISFVSATSVTTEKNTSEQSTRIQELNQFWNNLSKTVKEGDFEGYKDTYHKDAVIIFASGKNKTSVPIEKALASWKQGFVDTKNGKNKSSVEFRFSQRIGDATTAHETGIFVYKTSNADGSNEKSFPTHFEMLMVKRNGKWLGLMEYQKANATMKEWEALKK
jgi:ketosteroid isomerase-like protein